MNSKINELLNLVLDAGEKCKAKDISIHFRVNTQVNKVDVSAFKNNECIFSEYIYTDWESHSIDDLIEKTKQFLESI